MLGSADLADYTRLTVQVFKDSKPVDWNFLNHPWVRDGAWFIDITPGTSGPNGLAQFPKYEPGYSFKIGLDTDDSNNIYFYTIAIGGVGTSNYIENQTDTYFTYLRGSVTYRIVNNHLEFYNNHHEKTLEFKRNEADTHITPADLSSGISVTPTFAWGQDPDATGYEFKLGTDKAFSQVLDYKTNISATEYRPSVFLKNTTSYYWEVRAWYGSQPGDWILSNFTTQN
jgi:hypothetical protein